MGNRFVDEVTPLNADTLNQFEADLKDYADTAHSLYAHKITVAQGSGESYMVGYLTVYTYGSAQINTISELAAALGISNSMKVAVSGRYDYISGSRKYYNIVDHMNISPTSITLLGHRIGLSDDTTGIVTYLNGSGTIIVTDSVSAV